MKNIFYLLIVLTIGCYAPVVFDDAYPKGEAPLETIPEHLQGIFMCESDSTIVTIDEKAIYAWDINYFEESIERINERESCTLIGNEIYFEEIEECVPVEFMGEDSVKGQYSTVDTLFYLNDRNIAKNHRGSIVLSQYVAEDEWILSLLSLDSYNNIYYRAINENSELEELAEITNMKQIGVDRNNEPIYRVKPTTTEFDKIFEHESIFIVCEYLMRVNLEEFPYFVF